MGVPLHVEDAGESHCIARLDAIQIQLWRGEIGLEHARRARESALGISDGGCRGLLIVAEAGSKAPTGETRAVLTSLGTSLDAARGCAFVSEAEGFLAGTMRRVMAGMALLTRPPFHVKVFADADKAARWLAETTGEADGQALVRALARAREIRSA